MPMKEMHILGIDPVYQQAHLSTENTLAILPMARILFLMTSFRAAAVAPANRAQVSWPKSPHREGQMPRWMVMSSSREKLHRPCRQKGPECATWLHGCSLFTSGKGPQTHHHHPPEGKQYFSCTNVSASERCWDMSSWKGFYQS